MDRMVVAMLYLHMHNPARSPLFREERRKAPHSRSLRFREHYSRRKFFPGDVDMNSVGILREDFFMLQ